MYIRHKSECWRLRDDLYGVYDHVIAIAHVVRKRDRATVDQHRADLRVGDARRLDHIFDRARRFKWIYKRLLSAVVREEYVQVTFEAKS